MKGGWGYISRQLLWALTQLCVPVNQKLWQSQKDTVPTASSLSRPLVGVYGLALDKSSCRGVDGLQEVSTAKSGDALMCRSQTRFVRQLKLRPHTWLMSLIERLRSANEHDCSFPGCSLSKNTSQNCVPYPCDLNKWNITIYLSRDRNFKFYNKHSVCPPMVCNKYEKEYRLADLVRLCMQGWSGCDTMA